jgi:cell division septation protein DedD
MKNSIGVIVFIFVVLLAAAYLFLGGGEEDIQRPTRIAKRVKIDVPPPTIINPDDTKSSGSFLMKKNEELIIEESINDPQPEVVFQKIEDNTFQVEDTPVKDPVKRAEKMAPTQKQIIASKTPKMLVTTAPKNKAETFWVVNVVSVRSRNDANNFIDKLKGDSYNVYLTTFDKDSTHWYRVRVGFFAEKQKAEKVGQDISNRYRLDNYWIVKPSKKEISANR